MSEFRALEEARGKLDAVQAKMAAVFSEAGAELDMGRVTSISGDSKAKVEQIQAWEREAADHGAEVARLESVKQIAARVAGQEAAAAETKKRDSDGPASIGGAFLKSAAYGGRKQHAAANLDVEIKALFETATGWTPETTRTGRVVDMALRPVQVTDLFPLGATTQQAIVYMEETTYTNAAFETAEGGQYPDAALALTEKSSPVRKVTVSLGVTDEQLDDEVGAEAYINRRLPFMIRQHLDKQLLVGTGADDGSGGPVQLKGLLNTAGIQTQAKGSDVVIDAIHKALTKVRVTGRAVPNAVVMHSSDWQDIRLLRTADGVYIFAPPSEVGQPRLWGLPVVETEVLTEGTAVVGDFQNYSELAIRKGLEVQVSNSHSDDFLKGKQHIRADLRAAVTFYRPAAFATVTGI